MDFGMKLQSLRKEKGLSQEALAEKLNVSRQAVSKWETGEGYPEMDKIILLSDLFQVSLDYLIKDSGQVNENSNKEDTYFMTSQKIKEYLEFKSKFGLRIGGAVMLFILSVLLPVWCSDTPYEKYGIFGMLCIVAIGVVVIIFTGMASEKHSELENKKINMSFNDLQSLQEEYSRFKAKFGMAIASGVGLIILAVAGVVLIGEGAFEDKMGPSLLFVCVACSVYVFITTGVKDGAYKFLVQNKRYIAEKNAEQNSLFSITMPLAAMAYLVIGFTTGYWHPGWIIFPVVAIITSGIEALRGKSCKEYE
ncbi:MAG: helix-turn-helix transcriptional regulator [Coprobacillus sp.]